MTFTEAAVEVLRLVGKPLHYKKITEIAIERNLLSHVGKTPETTMSSRLATMVKKDRGDAPILKVKPGVFALREFPSDVVEDAGDATGQEVDIADLPEDEQEAEETVVAEPIEEEEEVSAPAQELPGADVFPEEEDDDELILANLDEEERESRNRRKRRGRRRREREQPTSPEARSERRTEARNERKREAPATRAAEPGESVGRDLADAIQQALKGRSRQSKSLQQIAEALIKADRLSGAPAELAPTIAAAIRGDNARRRASAERPRFREAHGSVSLFEWDLPTDAVKAEQDAARAAERQRQSVHRALIKQMRVLPDGALLELLATWLNAVGVHSLRGVRAEAGDFSLAGTLRRGPEEMPLAIVIYRGKQPVTNEAIVELRGALHRFDHARVGWVITLGQVREGALGEAHAEGAAPCAVFDSDALAASMEKVGVGVHRVSLPLAVLDIELLESLGGGAHMAVSESVGTDSNGTRRRRSRRRSKRRTPREAAAEETSSEESLDAAEDIGSEPPTVETPAEAPETPEETPAEAPVEPELEAEQV